MAAQDPKGGLRSVVEGLGVSCRPCAGVLSVAGFSALLARFPPREWFILREKEASFRCRKPLLFNLTAKSVKLSTRAVYTMVTSAVYSEAGRLGAPYKPW